jgi:hypothetical protein
MKKERLSILVLVVEIAAIIFLHSAKTRESIAGNKVIQQGNNSVSAAIQLNVLPIAK